MDKERLFLVDVGAVIHMGDIETDGIAMAAPQKPMLCLRLECFLEEMEVWGMLHVLPGARPTAE